MKISKILEKIESKIKECNEYQTNINCFNYYSMNIFDLSMRYMQEICRAIGVYDFKTLDKILLDDEYIQQFILRLKAELDQEQLFIYDFLRHLLRHKPKSFAMFDKWIENEFKRNNMEIDIPKETPQNIRHEFVTQIYGSYIKTMKPMDVFYTMIHDDTDSKKIQNYLEIIGDKELTLLEYRRKMESSSQGTQTNIANKTNLIKLLDYCDEYIRTHEKYSFDIILKNFQEANRYNGSLSVWNNFFKAHFSTIKDLTKTQFTKPRQGLFELNENRQVIDNLFGAIKKYQRP